MFTRHLLYLYRIMRRQWHDPERLKDFQEKRLRDMLHHAYGNSLFYKEKFKRSNMTPFDIKGLNELNRIPFTTKREIIENFPDSIIAKNYRNKRLHYRKTSGSSGLRMTVATDEACEDYYDCIYARALFSVGYRPWQSMAYFWPPTYHRKKIHEYFGLMKKQWLSSTLPPERQVSELARIRPGIIYGFPTTLVVIAKIVERDKRLRRYIRPRFIISHAETLFEDSRKYIENVFNCPVYNEYGATEFTRMAWECRKREGLHVDIDSVIMEIVRDGKACGPGEPGEIVLTSLHNYAMPLIRYRIGDIGVFSEKPCSCGRGLPLLKSIEGRKDDFLLLPSGRKLSPRHIVPLIERFQDVTEFRLVQERKDRMILHLVTNPRIGRSLFSELKEKLYGIIERDVALEIKVIKGLDRNQTGKTQAIICKLTPDRQ